MVKCAKFNTIFDHYFVEQREPRGSFGRNKTRVVTFRVPHNAAVQIYDYKEKTARYSKKWLSYF